MCKIGCVNYARFPKSAHISGFTGITTDPFSTYKPTNGMKFTTKDRDNDIWHGENCAVTGHGGNSGGWWYSSCGHVLINDQYKYPGSSYSLRLNGETFPLPPFIEMKIKPITCNA